MRRGDEDTLVEAGRTGGEATLLAAGRTGVGDTMLAGGVPTGVVQTIAAGAADAESGEEDAIERGALIDRYVVVARLGAGGMGVVHAAYDPELDRKVALKLLRARTGEGTAASIGKARLLREAQALARLSHPHVVAIHDVGTVGDRVWLAMEYIDGMTFGTWLSEQKPRWPAILDVMRAVGEGLAAAHAAGLVHRDLKPDNIMIGRDGRVRVMDFGLARAASDGDGQDPGGALDRRVFLADVTQAGAVMGTPAYMSPEQWRGEQADARADQFAFCVTMWEAVHGERPFRGETLAALAGAIMGGDVRAPPRGSGAPAWLRRVLLRGLATDPARRFASMSALLAALASGQARGRRLRRAGLLIAALGLAVAVPLWQRYDVAQREAACVAAGAAIGEVWDEAARARLAQAFGGADGAAPGTFEKMTPWIDDWTERWTRARVEACVAAEVERTEPPERDAAARACLAERSEELAGLLDVVVEDPKGSGQRAVSAAATLTPVETCRDPATLAHPPQLPDDPIALVRIGALRREVQRIRGMNSSGRYVDALKRVEALRARAVALGHPPLIAEADLMHGLLLSKLQKYVPAEDALRRAFTLGGELGLDEIAANAAIEMMVVVGYGEVRHEAATGWATAADMFVGRLGKRDDLLGARYLNSLASYTKSRGDLTAALAMYDRALAIREAILGPDHPDVCALLNNAANTYEMLGDSKRAQAMLARALERAERTLGEGHLLTIQVLSNLSISKVNTGALDEAKALEERALALRERVFGPEHTQVAMSETNLGQIYLLRGDHEAARRVYESALAIYQRNFDPDSAQVANARTNLALVLAEQGALVEAQALSEQVLAAYLKLSGPDSLDVAWSLNNLSSVLRARGELARARELELRALEIRERQPESRELALSLANFATIEMAYGRVEAARATLRRTLAIREKTLEAAHPQVAETLVVLASAEVELGDLADAESHATRAMTILSALHGADDSRLAGPVSTLGLVALARGRTAEAVQTLERASTLQASGKAHPVDVAELRFALARALVADGRDGARARQLAEDALAGLREFAGGALPRRAEVEAWLRRRGER